MRFRSLPSKAARTTRLALETLEHRTLLAADGLTPGLQQDLDSSPVNDTAETAVYETVDSNLVVLPGDANRDGVFNQQDLVQLFMAGKYLSGQSADWSEGDWNGDNVFDQRDLVAALQIGNYSPQSNSGHGPPHQNEGNAGVLAQLAAEEAARIAADADLQAQIDTIEEGGISVYHVERQVEIEASGFYGASLHCEAFGDVFIGGGFSVRDAEVVEVIASTPQSQAAVLDHYFVRVRVGDVREGPGLDPTFFASGVCLAGL